MPFAVIIAALLSLFVAVGIRSFPSQKTKVSPTPTVTSIEPSASTIDQLTATTTKTQPKLTPTIIFTITPTITKKVTTLTPTQAYSQLGTNTPTPNSSDMSAPVLDQMTGPGEGSTVDFNNFCFPMKFSDATAPITVRYAIDTAAPTDWNQNYSPCYSSVSNGSHTFMVQAKDGVGNMTGYIRRSFLVSVANPASQITQSPTPTVTVSISP